MSVLARYNTRLGPDKLPMSQAMVLAGFVRLGLPQATTARAMENLRLGLPVLVGGCLLTRQDRRPHGR